MPDDDRMIELLNRHKQSVFEVFWKFLLISSQYKHPLSTKKGLRGNIELLILDIVYTFRQLLAVSMFDTTKLKEPQCMEGI